jgi:hypothetical protein
MLMQAVPCEGRVICDQGLYVPAELMHGYRAGEIYFTHPECAQVRNGYELDETRSTETYLVYQKVRRVQSGGGK